MVSTRVRLRPAGQLEFDWKYRGRRTRLEHFPTKPAPYSFAPIDERYRLGDEQLCKILRCSWVRLAIYRRDGLTEYQADRTAMRLFEATPYEIWPDYGFTDDYDLDDEDDDDDW